MRAKEKRTLLHENAKKIGKNYLISFVLEQLCACKYWPIPSCIQCRCVWRALWYSPHSHTHIYMLHWLDLLFTLIFIAFRMSEQLEHCHQNCLKIAYSPASMQTQNDFVPPAPATFYHSKYIDSESQTSLT